MVGSRLSFERPLSGTGFHQLFTLPLGAKLGRDYAARKQILIVQVIIGTVDWAETLRPSWLRWRQQWAALFDSATRDAVLIIRYFRRPGGFASRLFPQWNPNPTIPGLIAVNSETEFPGDSLLRGLSAIPDADLVVAGGSAEYASTLAGQQSAASLFLLDRPFPLAGVSWLWQAADLYRRRAGLSRVPQG